MSASSCACCASSSLACASSWARCSAIDGAQRLDLGLQGGIVGEGRASDQTGERRDNRDAQCDVNGSFLELHESEFLPSIARLGAAEKFDEGPGLAARALDDRGRDR